MVNAKTEVPQKSVLQIKQDDKFFCRLLSKESSMSNPSFRIALAVPFVWESEPGTPKYTFSEDSLPPLTPPPPYHMNTINALKKKEKKRSKSNLFITMLPKLNLKKMILSSSSSYPSSWSSSSCSSKVVPMAKFGKKKLLSYGSSNDNERGGAGLPSSKLCFSIPRGTSSDRRF